jgi:hypothetical protein
MDLLQPGGVHGQVEQVGVGPDCDHPFGHGGTAVRGPATALRLCRLRYVGSASQWQFAMYCASHDD